MAERDRREPTPTDPDRPTTLLPLGQLVRLSVYWLGLVAVFQRHRHHPPGADQGPRPGPDRSSTRRSASSSRRGVIIAVLVQPTVGSISDYTISRCGRRKPYILIGTTARPRLPGRARDIELDPRRRGVRRPPPVQLELRAGPFQGYVPDLVPAPQVGLASGLVGLFTILGVVTGIGARVARGSRWATSRSRRSRSASSSSLTMLSLFFRLDEGRRRRTAAAGWPRSPPRRGAPTSCASAASCSSSPRASSSSVAARS